MTLIIPTTEDVQIAIDAGATTNETLTLNVAGTHYEATITIADGASIEVGHPFLNTATTINDVTPSITGIPNQTPAYGDAATIIDLSGFSTGTNLVYSVASSNGDIDWATISGSNLTIAHPASGGAVDDDLIITASNSVGSNNDSMNVVYASVIPEVPSAINDLSATAGNTEVTLTWTAPAENNSVITDYLVEYKLSASGAWLTFADGVSGSTGATVTGLINDSAYDFRVSAINGVGTGASSNVDSETPVSVVLNTYLAGTLTEFGSNPQSIDTQHAWGRNQADFRVDGTGSDAPFGTSVEVQMVDATTSAVVHSWQTLDDTVQADGSYQGWVTFLNAEYSGELKMQCRIVNSSQTPVETTGKIWFAHNVILLSQSEGEYLFSNTATNQLSTASNIITDDAFQLMHSRNTNLLLLNSTTEGIPSSTVHTTSVTAMVEAFQTAAPNSRFHFNPCSEAATSQEQLLDDANAGRDWADLAAKVNVTTSNGRCPHAFLTHMWQHGTGYKTAFAEMHVPMYSGKIFGTGVDRTGVIDMSSYSLSDLTMDHDFTELFNAGELAVSFFQIHEAFGTTDTKSGVSYIGGVIGSNQDTELKLRQEQLPLIANDASMVDYLADRPIAHGCMAYLTIGPDENGDLVHPGLTEYGGAYLARMLAYSICDVLGLDTTLPMPTVTSTVATGQVAIASPQGDLTTHATLSSSGTSLDNGEPVTDVFVNGRWATNMAFSGGDLLIDPIGASGFDGDDVIEINAGTDMRRVGSDYGSDHLHRLVVDQSRPVIDGVTLDQDIVFPNGLTALDRATNSTGGAAGPYLNWSGVDISGEDATKMTFFADVTFDSFASGSLFFFGGSNATTMDISNKGRLRLRVVDDTGTQLLSLSNGNMGNYVMMKGYRARVVASIDTVAQTAKVWGNGLLQLDAVLSGTGGETLGGSKRVLGGGFPSYTGSVSSTFAGHFAVQKIKVGEAATQSDVDVIDTYTPTGGWSYEAAGDAATLNALPELTQGTYS